MPSCFLLIPIWITFKGLPFFAPLYNPESNVNLYAGHLDGDNYDLRGIIGTMLMKDPVFPVYPVR